MLRELFLSGSALKLNIPSDFRRARSRSLNSNEIPPLRILRLLAAWREEARQTADRDAEFSRSGKRSRRGGRVSRREKITQNLTRALLKLPRGLDASLDRRTEEKEGRGEEGGQSQV